VTDSIGSISPALAPVLKRELAGASVVVTGAAGFIGGHIVRSLAASGAGRIVAVDERPLPDLGSGLGGAVVDPGPRDIRDPLDDLVAGADIVFHLAARISVPRSVEDPLGDCLSNVVGTVALLDSCRRVGVRRFVYSSSAAVYGAPVYLPVDESHPTRPESPYGLSKLTGERYSLLYNQLHGLSAVALRYFNVYGPGQPISGGYASVIRHFANRFECGLALHVEGDGYQTRDFVHVQDVVRANFAAATSAFAGALNVGSGVATSISDLARLIGGPTYPVEHGPPRAGDIRESVASVEAARDALGFVAQIPLAIGLASLGGARQVLQNPG
jgi:UDP-glucose 4-epimerase